MKRKDTTQLTPLTTRETEVLAFIARYAEKHDSHAPSYQSISDEFSFTKAMAKRYCIILEGKGWLEFGQVEPPFRIVKVIHTVS